MSKSGNNYIVQKTILSSVMAIFVGIAYAAPPGTAQIRPGGNTYNPPVLTVQGSKVYKGSSTYGPVQ